MRLQIVSPAAYNPMPTEARPVPTELAEIRLWRDDFKKFVCEFVDTWDGYGGRLEAEIQNPAELDPVGNIAGIYEAELRGVMARFSRVSEASGQLDADIASFEALSENLLSRSAFAILCLSAAIDFVSGVLLPVTDTKLLGGLWTINGPPILFYAIGFAVIWRWGDRRFRRQ